MGGAEGVQGNQKEVNAMKSIDRLIFETLARRRSVFLVGLGTLEVKWRGARRISETRIVPPRSEVVFTPDELEGSVGVISLVGTERGVDESEAIALYGSWLEAARRPGGTMSIDGVGVLSEEGMTVDRELHMVLNPTTNEEILTMETERNSTPLWAWIVIGILAALLVLGIIWGWKKGLFEGGGSRQPVVETVVIAPAPPPAGDSLAVDGGVAAAAVPSAATAPRSTEPRFHVIAGAFSIESNADKFMARLKREHPELTPEKITNPENGYHMVSIFQMPTERAARGKMNLYWDIDLYLWVYAER